MMKNKSRDPGSALILLVLGGIAAVSQCCQDLHCVIDFIDTLACEYREDKDLNTSVSHTMSANWTFEELYETCILIECEKKHEYICTIDMEDFSVDGKCTLTITTNVNGRHHSDQICQLLMIGHHFKPVPPFNLTISLLENYNISWETDYDKHIMRSGELAYELSYKMVEESWLDQKTIQILEDDKNVVLLRSSFQPSEQYVARIRAHPKRTSIYRGHWSEWSETVAWTTPTDQNIKIKIGGISGTIAILAFLGILLTCFRYTPLMWKKVWVVVPDPEPFFKPLYKGHQGDFKSWLGPHYIPFPIISSDGGSTYPEVLQIDDHNMKKQCHSKTCLMEKNQFCRTCGDVKMNPGLQCAQCNTLASTTTDGSNKEEERSTADGYPTFNMPDHLLYHESNPVRLKLGLHEDFLRSNINMLNQVSIPQDEWELQESPSQEDSENVFYNDNYHSLSPDSGTSSDFGYPRICLDMDTIDSGFVDSECGSPVESDFGNSDNPTKPLNPEPYNGEDEKCERNYVQQWVPTAR
ncbi:interleukin-21 receptor isoform 1-T3 [Anomaloglossus baeobatrachus]|uniref:interleukin-21 receptor n=1 Tax=Anomaloglossus baeobatrachus TaxID=238106 RepID=UPI003F4F7739